MASHAMARGAVLRTERLGNGSQVRMVSCTRRGRPLEVIAEYWDGACWATRSYVAEDELEAEGVFEKFLELAKEAPRKRR